jgi:hypothetical protein
MRRVLAVNGSGGCEDSQHLGKHPLRQTLVTAGGFQRSARNSVPPQVCKPLVIENPRTTIQLVHTGSANGHRVRTPGGDHDREPEAPTRLCAMSRSTAPRSSATNPRRAPSRRRSFQPRPSRCPPPGSSMATSFGSRRLTARSTRCSTAGSAITGTASRVPGPQSGRRSGGQPPLHDRRQPDRLIQPGRRAAGEELVPGAARGGARLAPMPDIAKGAARPFQVHRPCP